MRLRQFQILKWGIIPPILGMLLNGGFWTVAFFTLSVSDWSFFDVAKITELSFHDVPEIVWVGIAFLLLALIFFPIFCYLLFGVEVWNVENGVLYKRSSLFGMTVRRNHWLLSNIESPAICREICDVSGGGFDTQDVFGSRRMAKGDWLVYVTDRKKRRSVRIYWSVTKKHADEFLDFVKAAKINYCLEAIDIVG